MLERCPASAGCGSVDWLAQHGLGLPCCAGQVLILDFLEQRDDWTEQSDESSGCQGSSECVHDSAFARGQAGGQASADANDDGQDNQFHGLTH